MHIGLIGGIGPAATVAYYRKMTDAFARADIPLRLTIDHADMALLTRNAREIDTGAQAEVFAKHVRALEGAGCDLVGITALTGHFCLSELRQVATLPILSATEVIDSHCTTQGIERIGLLGSPAVLQTRLFGQLTVPDIVVPEPDSESVGETYMQIATAGCCSPEQADLLVEAGAAMIHAQGAEAALLAGTDLGLAFDGRDPGYPTINALNLHVGAFVEAARRQ